MANRTVNIGLVHQAALAGMEAGIASSFGVDVCGYHDHLIYTAMIQSGVQRFRIIGPISNCLKESEFLSARCKEYPFEKYVQVMTSVHDKVSAHSPQDKESKSTDTKLVTLRFFLADLLLALETKSAMVSIFGIPDVAKLKGKVSPDLYSVLTGLMSIIEPIELISPVPQWNILSQDVEIFQDILTSDLFKAYSSSHKMLESNSEKTQLVVKDIVHKGNALASKYSRFLEIKKIPLSLVPVTTTIIDSIFGKIPGAIADLFGQAFVDFVNKDKRITIYDYGNVHVRLLNDHYSSLASQSKDILQPES